MNPNLLADTYIQYIRVQKRYSSRTQELYADVLLRYYLYIYDADNLAHLDKKVDEEIFSGKFSLPQLLSPNLIRGYLAKCMEEGLQARSVNLHLSALSGYCRWLLLKGELESNPARSISRPKEKSRLHKGELLPYITRQIVVPFDGGVVATVNYYQLQMGIFGNYLILHPLELYGKLW